MLDVPVVVERVEGVNCEGDLSLGAGRPVASRDFGAWRQVLKGMGRLQGGFSTQSESLRGTPTVLLLFGCLIFACGFGQGMWGAGSRLFVPYSSQ
jgi:hypothetical protein